MLGVVAGGLVYLAWSLSTFAPSLTDFPLFYATVEALVAHRVPAYPIFTIGSGAVRNLSPPHFHLLLVPLSPFSMEVARNLWRVESGLGVILAIWVVRTRVEMSWIAAALWSAPMALLLILGQVAGVLSVLLSLVWTSLRAERWALAGICLGILVSMKLPFGLLVVWLVLERRWRAVGFAVLGLVGACVVGVLWVGVEPYREWASALLSIGRIDDGFNASWFALAQRALPESLQSWFAWTGVAAISLMTLLQLKVRPDLTTRLLGVSLAAFLISPLGWVHYMAFVIGPLVVWLAQGNRWPPVA